MLSRPDPARCRPDELPDYVSGQLAPERTRAWERHLISCAACQHAVAGERRLQSLLATGCPSMPGSLHAQLMALAASMPPPQAPARAHSSLQMVPPSAPPAHRSPLRSAALATAAAGATAAVAWSLTLTGAGVATTTVSTVGGAPPSVRPASDTMRAGTAHLRVRTVSTGWTSTTSVRDLVLCEAESTT